MQIYSELVIALGTQILLRTLEQEDVRKVTLGFFQEEAKNEGMGMNASYKS